MADAILYSLPNGIHIAQDVEEVTLIPSDGGKVEFVKEGLPEGTYRVRDSRIKYFVGPAGKVHKAFAYIELDYANEGSSSNV